MPSLGIGRRAKLATFQPLARAISAVPFMTSQVFDARLTTTAQLLGDHYYATDETLAVEARYGFRARHIELTRGGCVRYVFRTERDDARADLTVGPREDAQNQLAEAVVHYVANLDRFYAKADQSPAEAAEWNLEVLGRIAAAVDSARATIAARIAQQSEVTA
jgi:hypothetical protein